MQPVRDYSYYPGVDQPHAVRNVSTGAVFYYLTSGAGNVTALVNTSNQVVNRYEYTPFGQAISATEQVRQPFRFAGRELDAETGLYFNRARYYDPSISRFISEDPSGLEGGVNQYAYVGNDPVNYSDPSGLCKSFRVTYRRNEDGDWIERQDCLNDDGTWGTVKAITWGPVHPFAAFFAMRNAMNAIGEVSGVTGMGEGADNILKGRPVRGAFQVALAAPVFGPKPVVRAGLLELGLGKSVVSAARRVLSSGAGDVWGIRAVEQGGVVINRWIKGDNGVSSVLWTYIVDARGEIGGIAKQVYEATGNIAGTLKTYR